MRSLLFIFDKLNLLDTFPRRHKDTELESIDVRSRRRMQFDQHNREPQSDGSPNWLCVILKMRFFFLKHRRRARDSLTNMSEVRLGHLIWPREVFRLVDWFSDRWNWNNPRRKRRSQSGNGFLLFSLEAWWWEQRRRRWRCRPWCESRWRRQHEERKRKTRKGRLSLSIERWQAKPDGRFMKE